MLSDEKLRPIYVEAFNKAMQDTNNIADAGLVGLRAVAEAAVKVAVGGDEPVARLNLFNLPNPDGGGRLLPDTCLLPAAYKMTEGRYDLYTRPQASAAVQEDKWKPLLEAVMREMPRQRPSQFDIGNGPGHGHQVKGIWDSDNGDLAGKPCAWCLAWDIAKSSLAASQPEVSDGNNTDS